MFNKVDIVPVLDQMSVLFQALGVLVMVVGALYLVWQALVLLWRGKLPSIDLMRLELGRSIALGLEFFVGGDIIRTIITPDYYSIGILSILVVIRTVLTYFLNHDLATLRSLDRQD